MKGTLRVISCIWDELDLQGLVTLAKESEWKPLNRDCITMKVYEMHALIWIDYETEMVVYSFRCLLFMVDFPSVFLHGFWIGVWRWGLVCDVPEGLWKMFTNLATAVWCESILSVVLFLGAIIYALWCWQNNMHNSLYTFYYEKLGIISMLNYLCDLLV